MTLTLEIIFILGVLILFFCYAGYGLLLFVINKIGLLFRRNKLTPEMPLTPVTLIVAAYNEKNILEEKIANTLSLDYPPALFNIIFITDGSSDGSETVVRQYPRIRNLHQSMRAGKVAAIKRAVAAAETEVIIFSDANCLLNKESIHKLVRHFSDPNVGGVAGEKKIRVNEQSSAVGQAEGLYWKYESFLKKQDAGFHTIVGAAGELFAIRTKLFQAPDDNILLDDFIISMNICLQGYRIAYEPAAFAIEYPSFSLAEEQKRKVRISAGAYQSIGELRSALNFFRHPLLTFQYVSRRVLRWVFCPLLLILVFLLNILIADSDDAPEFYRYTMILQLIFYGLAIPGWAFVRNGRKIGLLGIPFYFVFMNACLIKGFTRYLTGQQSVLWEKSVRWNQ
jgi:biofilm PGA synthesis N-glycosyltransferase PgaC